MRAEKLFFYTDYHCARLAVLAAILVAFAASATAHTIGTISSTIPANGDLNPYGVAVVPTTTGALTAGNILVSNFNNSGNLQGTGTTIVQISPSGSISVFAQIDSTKLPGPCPGGVGLTTALVALKSGWVIVGSLPTTNGMSATAQAGCLLVLDSGGNVAETFYGFLINGPWDMAAADNGKSVSLFVTNVLNGTVAAGGKVVHQGTVVRLDLFIPNSGPPFVDSIAVIGDGFAERTDPVALVIGPTGVGLSPDGKTLYVADTLNNRIAAISDPLTRFVPDGTGSTLSQGGSINGPLGLTVAPDGNIVSVNGNDGRVVVTSPTGEQIARTFLDTTGTPPGNGALFGLAIAGDNLYFVDDDENALNLFH
jgi:DNA-binding beta-propeller fold protein YncE